MLINFSQNQIELVFLRLKNSHNKTLSHFKCDIDKQYEILHYSLGIFHTQRYNDQPRLPPILTVENVFRYSYIQTKAVFKFVSLITRSQRPTQVYTQHVYRFTISSLKRIHLCSYFCYFFFFYSLGQGLFSSCSGLIIPIS